ncbi:hypothetical protein EG68_08774 [Paragonimus skrjabini miyazakii]|uniref:Uncharacterized protein n=1 Tax=Paragonimus skrjabini miyazakii TaxID=59628 RepID=A0A8S9YPC6_9TREM|nr:hypothetical protein EG68_08773 [Paragonimus skrjabini miyazakii]KAF7254864.1 hypothetical protein EG68_08774 [Paragonimus skrjabini miyazakii]
MHKLIILLSIVVAIFIVPMNTLFIEDCVRDCRHDFVECIDFCRIGRMIRIECLEECRMTLSDCLSVTCRED